MLPLQSDPPIRLLAAFYEHFSPTNPATIVQAPDREMWAVAAVTDAHEVTLIAPDLGGQTTFSYQSAKRRQTVRSRPLPDWARYPAGVVVALGNAGLDMSGVFAVIAGEEPSGPRYLYSLGLVTAALAHHLKGVPYDAPTLSEIVERVRREYAEA